MKYNGVITKKINTIENYMMKLEALLPLTTKVLENDFFLKKGIEKVLQSMIEAMIDIASRIISIENLSPAPTSYEAIKKLETLKIIKDASKYENMIEFRNYMIKNYESDDTTKVILFCDNNLSEFKDFIK